VADDHPSIRAQLCSLVEAQPDLEIVGTGWSGLEALRLVHKFEPDVLVADQDMRDLDGMAIAAHLRAAGIDLRLVLFTTKDAEADLTFAGKTTDCTLDDESVHGLLTAIRRPRASQSSSRVT
jgi:DNA-binding NarL/FixJ family response regulator